MENLITKKELLDLTGISYGSLYRWKRKNLIPDAWFIHRATFTGHETFFPREKILERIDKILAMKEQMSLDDIALALDPTMYKVEMTLGDLVEKGITTQAVIDLYLARYGEMGQVDAERLLSIYLFHLLLRLGTLSRDEVFCAVDLLSAQGEDRGSKRLIVIRKLGVCSALLTPEEAALRFDPETAVVYEVSISKLKTEIKEQLGATPEGGLIVLPE